MITGNINDLAKIINARFIQRRDLYPKQLENGSYVCIQKPLANRHIVVHLQGKMTLGAYVLNQKSQTTFIVFDADDDREFRLLFDAAEGLSQQGITPYLETSRRGGHLWLFFNEAVSGHDARDFGLGIASTYDIEGMELFPKQGILCEGPGSLIRLPFGIHRKSGERYGFVQLDGSPMGESLEDQILVLGNAKTVPDMVVGDFQKIGSEIQPDNDKPVTTNGNKGESLSSRIKASVSAYNFISMYVQLSSSGRGLCPFHEDKNSSFSVNIEKNYWKCFAGCGSGSIIDFWMKWKNLGFKDALHELEEILL